MQRVVRAVELVPGTIRRAEYRNVALAVTVKITDRRFVLGQAELDSVERAVAAVLPVPGRR